MALTEAAKEAIYLKSLINDIGPNHQSITIFNDNKAANILSRNTVVRSKTKHISIRQHFIREKVESGDIVVKYKPTEIMEADVLTKGLPRPKHEQFSRMLGLDMTLKA